VGRPKLLDRSRVVDVALCQYWQHGVDSVAMADVARLSGFDRAGIYKEFGGESGLVQEVLKAYSEQHWAPRLPVLASCESPAMKIKMILDAFVNDNVMKDLSPYGVKDKNLKWPRPPAKVKGCAFYGMVISDSLATFTAKTKRQIKQVNEQSRDWFTEDMLDAKKLGELKEGVSVTEAVDFYSDQMLLMQMMRRMSFSKEHMLKATSMIMKSLFAEGVLAVKH
jgi:AcrR family transcriptional regulator